MNTDTLQESITNESDFLVWNRYFKEWSNIQTLLVCPDFIVRINPDLRDVIPRIEHISREFFFKIHVRKLQLRQRE